MFTLVYITVALLIIYSVLIGFYTRAWKKIPVFDYTDFKAGQERTRVSVIIPARNEALNILECLKSMAAQTYPLSLTEIIVVNDHSTDRTEELVRNFKSSNIRLVNLRDHLGDNEINSYKKKALEVAIELSSGDLIITTDADCTAPPDWIRCIVAFQQYNEAAFIAAPVKIKNHQSFLSIFQTLDFLTLQGITGAGVSAKFHSMCNGANLAYEKKAFYDVGGFKDIDNIASGDDMLLMHKMVTKYPGRYFFLRSEAAIITTNPALTLTAFLHQRIRWASKADKYDDKRIFAVLILVYCLNVLLLVMLVAGIVHYKWLLFFLGFIFIKMLVEYLFVKNVAMFFRQQHLMKYFPFLQPVHIFYTVLAGWFGKFGNYEWKSRKVK